LSEKKKKKKKGYQSEKGGNKERVSVFFSNLVRADGTIETFWESEN
jgi:hypothetical protein